MMFGLSEIFIFVAFSFSHDLGNLPSKGRTTKLWFGGHAGAVQNIVAHMRIFGIMIF